MIRKLIFRCAHRWFIPLMVLATLLLVLLPASVVRADDVVIFADPNLEAAVRVAIGKPTGTIYQSDVASPFELYGDNRGISNLSGLEYCTGAWKISLMQNNITDISPVAGLNTNLQTLYLNGNDISDIRPLSSLTRLGGLNLDSNPITDYSPVAGLSNLWWLCINYLDLTDISFISGLTGLTHLFAYGNRIADITTIGGLVNLQYLELVGNDVVDIHPLSGLTQLNHLNLSANKINDIGPLSGLSNLTWLEIEANPITDLSPVYGLSGLTALYIDSLNISDISFISNFPNLWLLHLGNNAVSDISPLSSLAGLSELWAYDNQISDVSPLLANTALSRVVLWCNPVSSESLETYVPQLVQRGVMVECPRWTPAGSNVSVAADADDCQRVNVFFNSVGGAGVTEAIWSSDNPAGQIPEGFTPVGQFFDISTYATYSGPVTLNIVYDEAGLRDESKLRLFHWTGSSWEDATIQVWPEYNVITGEVNSLSWFFIGGEWVWIPGGGGSRGVPVFPSIYIGIGAALGAGVLAYLLRRKMVAG